MEIETLCEKMDVFEQNAKERIDRLEERIDANMKDHIEMCQKLCITRINHIQDTADKAHQRLNEHKKSIECLDQHKNQDLGFRKAFIVVQGIVVLILAYVGLIEK